MIGGLSGFICEHERKRNEERFRPGAERLRQIAALYREEHIFKPGDIVMWKPGLKDCRFPDYGEPAVVLDVKPGNVSNSTDSGGNKYMEPCDLRIGLYSDQKAFMGFWVDGKRFEPYQVEKTVPINCELTCENTCPDGNQGQ